MNVCFQSGLTGLVCLLSPFLDTKCMISGTALKRVVTLGNAVRWLRTPFTPFSVLMSPPKTFPSITCRCSYKLTESKLMHKNPRTVSSRTFLTSLTAQRDKQHRKVFFKGPTQEAKFMVHRLQWASIILLIAMPIYDLLDLIIEDIYVASQ